MQTSPQHVPQFSAALLIQLNAHTLLVLQVRYDGVLSKRDLSEHDKRDLQEFDPVSNQ